MTFYLVTACIIFTAIAITDLMCLNTDSGFSCIVALMGGIFYICSIFSLRGFFPVEAWKYLVAGILFSVWLSLKTYREYRYAERLEREFHDFEKLPYR